MSALTVTEAPFAAIAALHARIPEFGGEDETWFAARCTGRDPLALIARADGQEAGYMVSYNKFDDGSYYCWMAAVLPACRRRGVLTALMDATNDRASARGYSHIRIKTRNNRREMLVWLIAKGFDILSVDRREPISETRIEMIRPMGGGKA